MAVVSFLFTSAVVVGGVVIYNNRDQIVDKITEEAVEAISEVLPDLIVDSLDAVDVPGVPTGDTEMPIPSGLPF